MEDGRLLGPSRKKGHLVRERSPLLWNAGLRPVSLALRKGFVIRMSVVARLAPARGAGLRPFCPAWLKGLGTPLTVLDLTSLCCLGTGSGSEPQRSLACGAILVGCRSSDRFA